MKNDGRVWKLVRDGKLVAVGGDHVDDILVGCESLDCLAPVKESWAKKFQMTETENPPMHLGFEINYDRAGGDGG